MYRNLIKNIIDSLVYLIKNKIQFNSLVTDSIQLNNYSLYKINIIPSFLQKND